MRLGEGMRLDCLIQTEYWRINGLHSLPGGAELWFTTQMLFALNTLSKSILNGTPRTLQQRDSITDFFRQRIAPPSSQMQCSHRKEHSRLGATSRVLTSLKKGNSPQRNGQNDGILDFNNISAKLVNVNSMCPKVS